MISIVILITVFFFTITFLIVSYLDLKFRRIPNNLFKFAFTFSLILNIGESILYFDNYVVFIFGKIFFFL